MAGRREDTHTQLKKINVKNFRDISGTANNSVPIHDP